MELFDYTKTLFSKNQKKWEEVPSRIKFKHYWMLNRFMSIKYPVQASHLSHFKINPEYASDFWHRMMSSLFSSPPGWMYAKTKKKDEKEKKLEYPTKEMIIWYCNKNEMSRKDFENNVKFFGDAFLSEIKKTEKILKAQGIL